MIRARSGLPCSVTGTWCTTVICRGTRCPPWTMPTKVSRLSASAAAPGASTTTAPEPPPAGTAKA